jgi:hypothetical protein
MARPKSWHWDHYHKDGMANRSHPKAYCNACTQHHFQIIEAREKSAYDMGQIEAMRSNSVLIIEGD